MKVACPQCHRHLDVSDVQPGATLVCPDCHAGFSRPDELPSRGILLNGYELRQELPAEGSFRVFAAWQAHGDRMLEMKFLTAAQQSNHDLVRRFLAEARLVGGVANGRRILSVNRDEETGLFFLLREKTDAGRPARQPRAGAKAPSPGTVMKGGPKGQPRTSLPMTIFVVFVFVLPGIIYFRKLEASRRLMSQQPREVVVPSDGTKLSPAMERRILDAIHAEQAARNNQNGVAAPAKTKEPHREKNEPTPSPRVLPRLAGWEEQPFRQAVMEACMHDDYPAVRNALQAKDAADDTPEQQMWRAKLLKCLEQAEAFHAKVVNSGTALAGEQLKGAVVETNGVKYRLVLERIEPTRFVFRKLPPGVTVQNGDYSQFAVMRLPMASVPIERLGQLVGKLGASGPHSPEIGLYLLSRGASPEAIEPYLDGFDEAEWVRHEAPYLYCAVLFSRLKEARSSSGAATVAETLRQRAPEWAEENQDEINRIIQSKQP